MTHILSWSDERIEEYLTVLAWCLCGSKLLLQQQQATRCTSSHKGTVFGVTIDDDTRNGSIQNGALKRSLQTGKQEFLFPRRTCLLSICFRESNVTHRFAVEG